jgi:hypothetical protein
MSGEELRLELRDAGMLEAGEMIMHCQRRRMNIASHGPMKTKQYMSVETSERYIFRIEGSKCTDMNGRIRTASTRCP